MAVNDPTAAPRQSAPLTPATLAAKMRAANPGLKNVSDDKIVADTLAKYPGLKSRMATAAPTKKATAAGAPPQKESFLTKATGFVGGTEALMGKLSNATTPSFLEPVLKPVRNAIYDLTLKPNVDLANQALDSAAKSGKPFKEPTGPNHQLAPVDAAISAAVPMVGPMAYDITKHLKNNQVGTAGLEIGASLFGEQAAQELHHVASPLIDAVGAKLSKSLGPELAATMSAGERMGTGALKGLEELSAGMPFSVKRFANSIAERNKLIQNRAVQIAQNFVRNEQSPAKTAELLKATAQKMHDYYSDSDAARKKVSLADYVSTVPRKEIGETVASVLKNRAKEGDAAENVIWPAVYQQADAAGVKVPLAATTKATRSWLMQLTEPRAKSILSGPAGANFNALLNMTKLNKLADEMFGKGSKAAGAAGRKVEAGSAEGIAAAAKGKATVEKVATEATAKKGKVVATAVKKAAPKKGKKSVTFFALPRAQRAQVLAKYNLPKMEAGDVMATLKSYNQSLANLSGGTIGSSVLNSLRNSFRSDLSRGLEGHPEIKDLWESANSATKEQKQEFGHKFLKEILYSPAPPSPESIVGKSFSDAGVARGIMSVLKSDPDAVAKLRQHAVEDLMHKSATAPQKAIALLTDQAKGYKEILGPSYASTMKQFTRRLEAYSGSKSGGWVKFIKRLGGDDLDPSKTFKQILDSPAYAGHASRLIGSDDTLRAQVGDALYKHILDKVSSGVNFGAKDSMVDPVALAEELTKAKPVLEQFYKPEQISTLEDFADGLRKLSLSSGPTASRFGVYRTLTAMGYLLTSAPLGRSPASAFSSVMAITTIPDAFLRFSMSPVGARWLENGFYKQDAKWLAQGAALLASMRHAANDNASGASVPQSQAQRAVPRF